MRRLVLLAALAGASLAPAAVARADYVIEGHGWGHGVGMSQYGAYGYALREGRDYRWILGHYYPGTNVGTVATARMRVLLKRTRTPMVCGASQLRDARGRLVRLSERRSYRLKPWTATGLAIYDAATGHRRARVQAPVRITGGGIVCVRGTADNGVRSGSYRGALRLSRDGSAVLEVNELGLESYLQGVVGSEMPTSWAPEALKAQAVVARSYALRSRRGSLSPFDVYADTRSQMYRGIAAEDGASVAAVRATRAQAVLYGVEVAQTFFHSTSGGRTATNEEAFGGLPVPYLRSVDDPYDSISPLHDWSVTLTDKDVAKKLKDIRTGDLQDLGVSARTLSDRAQTVDVVGSDGTVEISGNEARSALGLRSTWFTITHTSP